MRKILYTLLIWLMLVGVGFPATHYVSTNGAADWADCVDVGDTGTDACSITEANTEADVDDIVVLRTGDYTTQQIIPANSGTGVTDVITFQKDTGATCTFSNLYSPSVYLNGISYIVIDGLTFGVDDSLVYSDANAGGHRHVYIYNGSDYNEIKNCTSYGSSPVEGYPDITIWTSDHNYIHDNTFEAGGEASSSSVADTIKVYGGSYNRIIDNEFNESRGHFFVMLTNNSFYNVVRGNTVIVTTHWDGASDPLVAGPSGFLAIEKTSSYNLIENNTLTNTAATNKNTPYQYTRGCSFNIFRKNTASNPRSWLSTYNDSYGGNSNYNTTYNNTIYHTTPWWPNYGMAIIGSDGTDYGTVAYNQFVNNIFDTCTQDIIRVEGTVGVTHDNQFRGNIVYGAGENEVRRLGSDMTLANAETNYGSEFLDNVLPTSTEPTYTSAGTGDFTADDGDAPQVDAGAWLTTVDGGTTSTTFTVDDYPYMFYPGWGDDSANADTIKTENGQTGVIESINYGAKQIILTAAITVVDGEGIALDYSGTKPDIGAEEYSATVTLSGFYPANGVGSVPVTADLTWTNGAGITDVHAYFDDADCTTAVVDGDIETYEIPGDMALSDVFYWKLVANPDAENITYPPTGCYTFTTTSGPPVTAANKGDMIWNINAGDTKFNINAGDTKF